MIMKIIEELILRSTEEVWGNSPYNGSPEFEGHKVNEKLLAKLIIDEVIKFISTEQDAAEQNWQCSNGVHITHQLKKKFE